MSGAREPRRRGIPRRLASGGVALTIAMVASAASFAPVASALAGLTTGFSGDAQLNSGTRASVRWLKRAAHDGAGVVRVTVVWSSIAPRHRPRGFHPSHPASKAYDWTRTDAEIRDMSAQGLTVLASVLFAPTWAEGPHRPRGLTPGTWRPDPAQFADFAKAAAIRYSGRFPDPLHRGQFLPRVSYWQAWNEPNLAYFLSPEWVRTRSGWAPAAPDIYRNLLNAFYRAVKDVDPSNFVVMAGTAPYGDPPGNARMRPAQFYRYLFCVSAALRRTVCPGPVHLDAVDHHPYELSDPPTHPAYWSDEVVVPDMWKIERVLNAGERVGVVLPRGHKQVWVTELIWDSNPPSDDVSSVPLSKQALYLEQAMYLLWRQGVDTVLWYAIRDDPPVRHYAAAFDWGGLYFYSGKPKPSATAFRFPFVTARLNSSQVQAWGRAPAAGLLTISRELGSQKWAVIARLVVGARDVFVANLPLHGAVVLRAQVAGSTSLPWSQRG